MGEGAPKELIGKRVALNHMPSAPGYIGTWRQYTYMSVKNVYPFPDSLDFDDIANAMGANPITVAGFMDTAEKHGHSVFINDAAASSLGRMLSRYCLKNGKTLINIVRKQEQVEILEKEGAKLILNSSEPDFFDQLKKMIKEYKPTAFFDAISGDFPGKVLHLMPEGSHMYVYGALSNQNIVGVDSGGLIFKNHSVSNFWIPKWINKVDSEVFWKWMDKIVLDMLMGGEIFGTKVSKTFKLSEFEEAMK